jgi:hypothetical protein
MDGSRFDRLAVSLTAGAASRRRLGRGLAGAAVGALLSGIGIGEVAARCVKAGRRCGRGDRCCAGAVCTRRECVCETGLTACGGRCVDTERNEQHCGACGVACDDGQQCREGGCAVACVPEEPRAACQDRVCGTTENSCGETVHCGFCRADQVCDAEDGTCACHPTRTECGGACVATAADPNHCGRCGRRCPSGTCIGGECAEPETCNGRDDDLDGEADEGNVCPANKVCRQGLCQCPADTEDCDGDGACELLGTDPKHCGSCGRSCPGGTCFGGECACPTGTQDCGGACIPEADCCGDGCPCPPGERECDDGACIPSGGCCAADDCPAGTPHCVGHVCQPCAADQNYCFTFPFPVNIVVCCEHGETCRAGCIQGSCAARCDPPVEASEASEVSSERAGRQRRRQAGRRGRRQASRR